MGYVYRLTMLLMFEVPQTDTLLRDQSDPLTPTSPYRHVCTLVDLGSLPTVH